MKWTDSIRQMKIILVTAAILIAAASLVVSHALTEDLKTEERGKMEVWAEAMRQLSLADENTDLSLVLKVINENNTIPVIVLDQKGDATLFRNVSVKGENYADSLQHAGIIGRQLLAEHRNIKIILDEKRPQDYIQVCYDDSNMLKRLALYPIVQLGVVLLFVVVAIFALLTSKRAEQNKVWVGLSKESAHQLGTPISSLMAWTEMLHETYPDDPLIPEMDKDVKRLQLVADRFSKIGSLPELKPTDLGELLQHVVDYMERRTSRQVTVSLQLPEGPVEAQLNGALFEWVVENLCKNAADAIGDRAGAITVTAFTQGQKAIVEVSDTGKGIRKKDVQNVFRPGFTTKKRGWGLGLSLAKRIVEEYHRGRIYVKSSEPGRGTTFRIEV